MKYLCSREGEKTILFNLIKKACSFFKKQKWQDAFTILQIDRCANFYRTHAAFAE
jgi:hypothetical protein